MNIFQKYAAGLLVLAISVLTALTGNFDFHSVASVLQFAIVVVQAATVFALGIAATKKWAGIYKTGSAAILAMVSAALPFFVNNSHVPTGSQWIIIGVAVLNALAAELGVQIRTDPDITFDPTPTTSVNDSLPVSVPVAEAPAV